MLFSGFNGMGRRRQPEASVILTITGLVLLQRLANSSQPERWLCARAHAWCGESRDWRMRCIPIADALWSLRGPNRANVASQAYPSLAEHLPPTQFTVVIDETGRAFGCWWGLAMGTSAYPSGSNQSHLDQSPDRGDEYTFDEHGSGVLSLREENARLRGLVVRLSTIILKNVIDQN
jgi:hypothetical protein